MFVARLLALKNSKHSDYQRGLKRLKCMGNFLHNITSLKENNNDIVVVKRPSKLRKISEYLPCVHCYGFYVIDELWKHTKHCDLKTDDMNLNASDIVNLSEGLLNNSNIVQQSRFLLDSACLSDTGSGSMLSTCMKTVITSMHSDELSTLVGKDNILLIFGEALLKKYGICRKNDISQRLRQLARLLLECRKKNEDSTLSFNDLLCSEKFDTCIEGANSICGLNITNDGRREFKVPSLALRLGHLLGKMVAAKQGFCLRNNNTEGLKEAERFGLLLQGEWTDTIATTAHNTLKRRKDQDIQILPVTEDLRLLRQYHKKEMRQTIDALQESHSYLTWRRLAQLIMTRLIIFNKRRGGEVSKLLLKTYTERPDWKKHTNEDILESMQGLERELLKRIDLVQIPGKKGRKVPVLITDDIKEGLEVLNTKRELVGIPYSNPFLFASRSTNGYLNNWQAMNLIAHEAKLINPDLVTSTRLRKYNATVSQLFDLNKGELEWLSNHMGHDLNIHKDFYRLHDSTIEIAKVSRLLMAIDSGSASQFVGIQLTDIFLEDFGSGDLQDQEIVTDTAENSQTVSAEPIYQNNEDEPLQNSAQKFDLLNLDTNKNQENDSEEDDHIGIRHNSRKLKRKKTLNRIVSDSEDEDRIKQIKTKKRSEKSPWTSQDLQILEKSFSYLLEQGIYPSGKQIQRVVSQNPCLKTRSVLNVRAKLQHLMKKKGLKENK